VDLDGFEPSTFSMPWKSSDGSASNDGESDDYFVRSVRKHKVKTGYSQSPERASEALFPICRRIPQLDVASSIPVSHSMFSMVYQIPLLALLRLCCSDIRLARDGHW
jgi:hypothetical protein